MSPSDYAARARRKHEAENAPSELDERPVSFRQWPQAIGDAALHGIVGDIVRTIEPHTEADPVAIVMQLLSGFGNAIGRSPHYCVEADQHYLNMNVLIVGKTASGRKGTSWGHVRRALTDADPDWATCITGGLSSGEGLIWEVRDAIERSEPIKENGRVVDYQTVIADPGVADKRRLIVETEFARPLKAMRREGNTLSTVIRQAWDSGNLNTMTRTSAARATGAHISIIAHITEDELQRLLDRTDVSNGFLNRFSIVAVRRSKCLPRGGSLAPQALAPMIAHLRGSLDFGRRAGLMDRDAAASALWDREYQRLTTDRPGAIGSITSRAAPTVMRLACLYAILDRSRDVRREHLAAALELQRYVNDSVSYVFGDRLGDATADTILSALRSRPEGLSLTEISSLFDGHKSASEISTSLAGLAEHGLATQSTVPTKGRSRQVWTANYAKEAEEAPVIDASTAISGDSSLSPLVSQAPAAPRMAVVI